VRVSHQQPDARRPAAARPQTAGSATPAAHGQRLNRLTKSERRSLTVSLLGSLLFHLVLLSLTFGGQGPGLPGFGLPWQERRIEAPDLHVVIAPAPPAPEVSAVAAGMEPEPQATVMPPSVAVQAPADEAPLPEPGQAEAKPPETMSPVSALPEQDNAMTEAEPELLRLVPRWSEAATTPQAVPDLITVQRPAVPRWIAPAVPLAPTQAVAVARSASAAEPERPAAAASAPAVQARSDTPPRDLALERARLERQGIQERAARRQMELLEMARAEAARLEAERIESARQAAVRLELAKQEAARLEAARAEAARLEAERIESARQAAVRLELAKQEAARQETARAEAARQEAARLEAERVELARQAAAREEAARQEAARTRAAQDEADAARREASRRAMGRQLDEEAAQRDAAAAAATRPSGRPPPSSSSARRGRLLGRTDTNAELVLYAEAWARKIQLNTAFDTVRELVSRPHAHPLVTVAVRRDGSVESVTFVVSSGVVEIDEAIRRIVQAQAPYQAFSPGLAGEYDVIELRRTWYFDSAVRLY
jgi:outer membrane biosynthesis protein TonB